MMLQQHNDPAEFLTRAGAFLESHAVENNLILSIASRLARKGPSSPQPLLLTLEDAGQVVLAALRPPPHKLVLTRGSALAIAILADDLARKRMSFPGVVGPTEAADNFATAWGKFSRQTIRPIRAMRIYQLTRLTPPPPVSGSFTQATAADLDLLTTWYRAFRDEIHDDMVKDDRQLTEVALREGHAFLWRDPQPVAMAVFAGANRHSARINAVYTPPAWRRRGYATAAVAALSQHLLDSGNPACCLFADLANRTANHIYRTIGFEPLSDFAEIRFEDR